MLKLLFFFKDFSPSLLYVKFSHTPCMLSLLPDEMAIIS